MKEELIRYRREKARETLEDATILFRSGRLFSALNRIYYALFYNVGVMGHGSFCRQDVEKKVAKGMKGQFDSLILHLLQK